MASTDRSHAATATSPRRPLHLLWLEITGLCQLRCEHCYAESGPRGDHGVLSTDDWARVLEQARELDVSLVQFIGGEPTLHPGLPRLVDHALHLGLEVEVYTNLVSVTDACWTMFRRHGVRLATSCYSTAAAEHDTVTRRRGSHARTLANIERALHLGIPLRVGILTSGADSHTSAAVKAQMEGLGVATVRVDVVRQVGRGQRGSPPGIDQLCGRCATGSLAVSATGVAWPCVFSRWLSVGDIRADSLATIHARADAVRDELASAFARRTATGNGMGPPCAPQDGHPCNPPCHPHYSCPPFVPVPG